MVHDWDMTKHLAVYVRVSSRRQDHKSQLPDLERWAAAQSQPVVFYRDKFTGKTMDRPGWQKLQAAIDRGGQKFDRWSFREFIIGFGFSPLLIGGHNEEPRRARAV